MTTERKFIEENVKRVLLKDFLKKRTERSGFGGLDIQRTPMGTRVTLIAERPGMVIGRKGETIKELTYVVENEFKFDNPQIEVKEESNPNLNPHIMAQKLATALERGWHFRRAGHSTVRRIMSAGAKGCQVIISGKLTGQRHRTEKFREGHIKYCGETKLDWIHEGYAVAKKKLGVIGIKVQIMDPNAKLPDEIELRELKEVATIKTEEGAPVELEGEDVETELKPEAEIETVAVTEPETEAEVKTTKKGKKTKEPKKAKAAKKKPGRKSKKAKEEEKEESSETETTPPETTSPEQAPETEDTSEVEVKASHETPSETPTETPNETPTDTPSETPSETPISEPKQAEATTAPELEKPTETEGEIEVIKDTVETEQPIEPLEQDTSEVQVTTELEKEPLSSEPIDTKLETPPTPEPEPPQEEQVKDEQKKDDTKTAEESEKINEEEKKDLEKETDKKKGEEDEK